MRMLQLALALSLLQVDPDNYLQQRLRNWDSQLELRDGDGWELEMLRAVPMVEYPYANRKTMMPLIEDLVRFDRQNVVDTHTNYNVTAYLVNISNDTSNTTAAMQELQTISSPPAVASATTTTTTAAAAAAAAAAATTTTPTTTATATTMMAASATGTMGLEEDSSSNRVMGHSVTLGPSTNFTYINLNFPSPDYEMFLSSEQFHEQQSIWEQNLADLSDFNDLPIVNSYANLPLKDGQQQQPHQRQDNNFMDLHLEDFLPSITGVTRNNNEATTDGAVALNDSVPNPGEGAGIKLEELDDDKDNQLLQIGIMNTKNSCWEPSTTATSTENKSSPEENCVKKEPEIKEEKIEAAIVVGDIKEEKHRTSSTMFVIEPDLNQEQHKNY
uniref:Uncharacterized protein n=1 Tax=Glossina brevipalpis TaxID=37001 RepID=A0A1A9WBE9_9MUSC